MGRYGCFLEQPIANDKKVWEGVWQLSGYTCRAIEFQGGDHIDLHDWQDLLKSEKYKMYTYMLYMVNN